METLDLGFDIYYINLERSTERNLRMCETFGRLKRIDAYDGTILDSYSDIYIQPELRKQLTKSNTPYEYGCSFSHIKAIITAYNDMKDEVIIMEDDIHVSYKSLWRESIQDIVYNAPTNTMCIQLSCIHPTHILDNIVNGKRYIKWDNEKEFWGTGAYYINRQGMKVIYDTYYNPSSSRIELLTSNIRDDIRADMDIIYPKINTCLYYLPLFDFQVSHSTIHQGHLLQHYACLFIIKEYFKFYSHYHTIFVCCKCKRKLSSNDAASSPDIDELYCSRCNKDEAFKLVNKKSNVIIKNWWFNGDSGINRYVWDILKCNYNYNK